MVVQFLYLLLSGACSWCIAALTYSSAVTTSNVLLAVLGIGIYLLLTWLLTARAMSNPKQLAWLLVVVALVVTLLPEYSEQRSYSLDKLWSLNRIGFGLVNGVLLGAVVADLFWVGLATRAIGPQKESTDIHETG